MGFCEPDSSQFYKPYRVFISNAVKVGERRSSRRSITAQVNVNVMMNNYNHQPAPISSIEPSSSASNSALNPAGDDISGLTNGESIDEVDNSSTENPSRNAALGNHPPESSPTSE